MILVDTSVWIEHIHKSIPRLAEALEEGQVVSHPFVIGELACGNIRARKQMLQFLAELPATPVAENAEALSLIERRNLMGKGLAYVDVHLLAASAIGNDVQLWTSDRRLHAAAHAMKLAYRP